MEGDGIRCLNKLFRALIVVVILLQCVVNPSLSLGVNNISSAGVTRCFEREREALLAFKQGLVDDYNLLSSWGREEHKQDCCKWVGIHCSNRTNHVTQLNLGWYDFQGKMMSPKLIELQHLKYLDLSWINFNGIRLPDFIGSLSSLRYLDLFGAAFGGRFPSQVGNLTRLQYLDLRSNHFANVENMNSWLPHLSALTYLDLSYNNLSNVPDWLEVVNKLPKLTNLSLSDCSLPSPLIHSSTLFNINSSRSLAHVVLNYNQLTSSIFLWLSKYNASLVYLDLGSNHFANVENKNSWLPHLSALTYLDLSFNNLSNVPDWLEVVNKLPKLTILSLFYCSLPSPLIHSSTLFNINSSRSLAHVDLSSNQLTSSIFLWLSKYNASLFQLDVSYNQLTGLFPDVIGNMSSLAYLDLSSNQFEGVISESHFSGLSRLRSLSLSSTSLTLNFHSAWVPPFQLDSIILGSCKMGPHFPNWLRTQKSYQSLDISNAGISDILPSWFWERLSHAPEIGYVDLSNNQIRGTIPN